MLRELLYTNLVFISETVDGLRNKFRNWKDLRARVLKLTSGNHSDG